MFPTDATLFREQKLADLGVTEPIDRLHRITDAKKRSAIALFPAAGQRFEHSILCIRCILHLVDQNVFHMVIEQQRNIARTLGGSEGGCCGQCDFNVIRDSSSAE